VAAVLAEIYLCGVCSCQEILRRNGRGQTYGTPGLVVSARGARRLGAMAERLRQGLVVVDELLPFCYSPRAHPRVSGAFPSW
jgi:hypothetical protein